MWDWADPEGSERRFRAVGTPEAMTQVARALGLRKRFGEAHKLLDAIDGAEPLVVARLALERGRLHSDLGEQEQALRCFKDALNIAGDAKADYYAVDAAHMIAICENNLEAHRSAIEMAMNSDDRRAQTWDASLLNNLGWSHFESGDYDNALECFQSALQTRVARGETHRSHVAEWCVARALRALERYDEALDILYPLLEKASTDGYIYDEIGECLFAKGNIEASRPYFDAAARLLPPEGDATRRRAELGRAGSFAKVGKNEITLTRAFSVDNDRLWAHIVGQQMLPKWLGTVTNEAGAAGHESLKRGMTFDLQIDNDASDVVRCEVEEFIYPRKLVINWNDTKLTITTVEGTLTLTHDGIDDPAMYGAAWHSAIDLLSHVMAGGSRTTFQENFDALLPEYRRLISRKLNPETR